MGSFTFWDTVTDAADSFHDRGMIPQLLAKSLHMGIKGAGMGRVRVFPNRPEEVVAVLSGPRAFAEKKEEFELGGGEIDPFVLDVKFEIVFVESEVPVGEDHGAGAGFESLENRLDPKDEFFGAEGFREIVIRARFEALDTVFCLRACGEHENRNIRGAGITSHVLQDRVAVLARKHEVEDDEGGALRNRQLGARNTVMGRDDLVALAGQIETDQLRDIDFVFNN